MGAQHEGARHHPRGLGGAPRPRRLATHLVAWTLTSRPPAVANSASSAALRDGTSYLSEIAAAVTVTERCGMRVSRNNQPSTPPHHAISSSLHRITASTIIISHLFTALFLSEACDLPPRASGPTIGRHCCTSTSTLINNEKKHENERPFRRKNRAVGQASQRKGCVCSVLRTGSVKMASLSTRSTAAQTEDPAWGGSSVWDWLTPTATKSAATQSADPRVDGQSLQHWPSTQEKYWLEPQKVQHSIQGTLEQSRDPGRRPRARSPTAMLEQLERISAASLKTCTLFIGAAVWSWCGPP